MLETKLLVVLATDPLGNGIGGIQTFFKGLVKCLPNDFNIELIGISTDKINRPVGKWQLIKINGKEFSFLPILYIKDENKRMYIPLSLRFLLSLFKYKSKISLDKKILEFHRIENAIIFRNTINKKVLFIHGNIKELYNPHSEIKWSKIPWLYFQLEKKIMAKMDKILVVSEQGLNFYKNHYDHIVDRFSFIPTWVDKDEFYPFSYNSIRKKEELSKLISNFSISNEDKILLFAGRLEESKNPLLLIDSFHHLVINNKNIKLLIVGTGNLLGKVIKKINEYKLEEKIKLLGVLSQDDLAKLMKLSDLFILTSACEGMPRVIVEALASGLPVVSTDVGEVKRIVKNEYSGILVSKHDALEISKSIMHVLKNKDKINLYNCVNSIRNYSIDIVLLDIYKMFRNLNNKKSKL